MATLALSAVFPTVGASRSASIAGTLDFGVLYDSYAPFVFRAVARLGVSPESVEDAVQEVFVVVHRRLGDLHSPEVARTWLYGIAVRVARNHRRTRVRRRLDAKDRASDFDLATVEAPTELAPDAQLARAQGARLLAAVLDELTDDHREVFVLAEMEEMTAPEIAEATGIGLNTVYSRLRGARTAFERAAARVRAREEWRTR